MSPQTIARFDTEFAPRIAETIAGFDAGLHVEVLPYEGHGHPTRVRIFGEAIEALRHDPYLYPLNLYLTWDSDEIERLMGDDGQVRFAAYLHAISRKLEAWRNARPVDFRSHTQAEPEILLGGLDFEG